MFCTYCSKSSSISSVQLLCALRLVFTSLQDRMSFHRAEGTEAACAVYKPEKMPHPNINIFLKSAAPVSFLIMGFEVIFETKFSCPCIIGMNQCMALFILFAPLIFAWVMMLLILNFITPESSGTPEESSGTPEEQGNNEKFISMLSFIPPAIWFCIFLINGDYCACLFTFWNGDYACNSSLHPNCLSWCKPEGENETWKYSCTLWVTYITKVNTKFFFFFTPL